MASVWLRITLAIDTLLGSPNQIVNTICQAKSLPETPAPSTNKNKSSSINTTSVKNTHQRTQANPTLSISNDGVIKDLGLLSLVWDHQFEEKQARAWQKRFELSRRRTEKGKMYQFSPSLCPP